LEKQWTILEALEWTEQRLARQGEEHPRLAAQMLASYATGLTRIELYTEFDKPLNDRERTLLRESIQRRLQDEPLQYIIGHVGFRYIELAVRSPVLIPRPETEMLVDLVLEHARQLPGVEPRILDVGTGTGAIALSLLHELPACAVIATDIDEAAVELAFSNAHELGLDGSECLRIIEDDLAGSLVSDTAMQYTFDVVVSNPPYVPTAEYEGLPPEIARFESRLALDGGADGLAVFRRLAAQAQELLRPGGLMAVELHESTLDEAATFVRSLPFEEIGVHTDLNDRPRYLTALRAEQ